MRNHQMALKTAFDKPGDPDARRAAIDYLNAYPLADVIAMTEPSEQ